MRIFASIKSTRGIVLLLLGSIYCFLPLSAQLNIDQLGQLKYESGLNDIWSYEDEQGRIYALVGARNGFSIVDINTPENPEELFFIPGALSTWRDIKTAKQHAYVVNETGGGMLIVDLRNLPESIDTLRYHADSIVWTAHNLWIDEFDRLYIVGMASKNDSIRAGRRGFFAFDIEQPMNPQLIGSWKTSYAHDLYTRGDYAYASRIYDGLMSIIDISDLSSPTTLSSWPTPSMVAHNAWLNDAGTHIFTTDETRDGTIASYDISDIQNPDLVAELKFSLTTNSTPHNVHVFNDYIVVSHYTDGIVVIDAANPERLIVVGYFDTNDATGANFRGCWGATPFLSNDWILAADIENGLFVLQADYQRAGYIEGIVSNAQTADPIFNARIEWTDTEINLTNSLPNGYYSSGRVSDENEYSLLFSSYGFYDNVVEPLLVEVGELLVENVALEPLDSVTLEIVVVDKSTGERISDAAVVFRSEVENLSFESNENGIVISPKIIAEDFQIFVGKWGYLHASWEGVLSDTTLMFELERGYQDDFFTDFGWEKSNGFPDGEFYLLDAAPSPYSFSDFTRCNPKRDDRDDLGVGFYLTEAVQEDHPDIDLGEWSLTSPAFDLRDFKDPVLSYYEWGCVRKEDLAFYFELSLSNGIDTVSLEDTEIGEIQTWHRVEKSLCALEPTDQMRVQFKLRKREYKEFLPAGLDRFFIQEGAGLCPIDDGLSFDEILVAPNPFEDCAQVVLNEDWLQDENYYLSIWDSAGRLIDTREYASEQAQVVIGSGLIPGLYLLRVSTSRGSQTVKIIKSD